jgi:hypothetical protein
MKRRSLIGALLALSLGGYGSAEPRNCLILAWKNERTGGAHERTGGALYVMNADGSQERAARHSLSRRSDARLRAELRRLPRSEAGPGVWTPDGEWSSRSDQ